MLGKAIYQTLDIGSLNISARTPGNRPESRRHQSNRTYLRSKGRRLKPLLAQTIRGTAQYIANSLLYL